MRNKRPKIYLSGVFDTPWKAANEVRMLLIKPFVLLYFYVLKIELQKGSKFYGFPAIFKYMGSRIYIGKRFEDRNWWHSNPLGINHPTIICTWKKDAVIKIGDDVGISGGAVVASKKIEIGAGTVIGANTTIIDTDFHPVDAKNRRYDKNKIKNAAVSIGKNVFLGANCLILKGVNMPDNVVIPAGAVVRSSKKTGYKF